MHINTLLFITHYGICLDIIRHTKTLFNVLHDSYTIEHHHVQKSLLASHALTYCDILYIFHAYNYTGIVTCTASLEFPHSPDAQICIAIVVIQIQEHQNHYDYILGKYDRTI